MAQNVSMEQSECCSVANVRLAPLGFCLKQSVCQLSIMLEKQICSGKIIVPFSHSSSYDKNLGYLLTESTPQLRYKDQLV